MFLFVHRGDVVVMLVPPAFFVQYTDMKTWMDSVDAKELAECPGALMVPGDTLWVPCGWVPLWCGVPENKGLLKERPALAERGRRAQVDAKQAAKGPALLEETVSVSFVMAYETDRFHDIKDEVRSQIAAANLASEAVYPKKAKKVIIAKEWLEGIKPAVQANDDDD